MQNNDGGLKTKDKWITFVEEKLGDHPMKNFRFGKIQWTYAFYRGEQYKIWDERLGRVRNVNIPRENRSVYNICKPFADAFVAKMLKNDPIPMATPFSTNTEEFDENLSLAFQAVSEYWWKSVVDGSAKLREICRWGAISGIGIAKIYWDKNLQSGIYDGDVNWEVVNPQHMFFNDDARSESEIRWGIHRFPKEKKVVEEEFKLAEGSLSADDKNIAEEERSFATKSLDTTHTAEESSTVLVHDIWIKKCREYKNGKHVVVAGGKTLLEEDNPDPDNVPFILYTVNDLLDDLYGQGIIFPILTIQRDMNRLNSLIMENSSLMGSIKWLIPEQANTHPAAFTDEGGEKVTFQHPYVPTQSQAAAMPNHIVSRFWELFRMAQFITKMQDVGMGMIPYRGSQTSPGVVKELKNSEDVMFAPEMEQMSGFVIRIMKRFRKYSKDGYIEDRIAQIMGDNKRMEAVTYKSKEDNNNYDFDFKAGAGFAKSDEMVVDEISRLDQTGFFDKGGVDRRVVTEEVLRRVGLTKIKEDTFADKRQAQRYLDMVLNNVKPIISKYINPDAHIKVFTDYTKQPQYDTLEVGIKFSIDWYIDQCNAIKMGMMLPGGKGGPKMQGQPPMPQQQAPLMPSQAELDNASLNRSQGTGQPMTDTAASQMAPQGVV